MTGGRRRRAVAVAVGVVVALGLPAAVAAPARADSIRDMEYWLDDYGFYDAWDTTLGEGATVAVIDTGVDGSVPELQGVVVDGADMSGMGSADGQTPVGENSQHGTMVASMIAGRGTGAGSGVIGVAPEASILSISVALGDGAPGSDDQIADAVRWAVDHGADVINMSLTRNSIDWPESWDDAFSYAFDNDVVVVAAAGNRINGTDEVGAPATIPGVVAVAGVDAEGDASFDASSQGITIAVAAPSEQLVAVVPGGGYVIWDGTSGAAPLVSGLAALVKSAHPELDAANVINRIIATATPKGEPVPGPIYGYGLIDAEAAVTDEVPAVSANPIGDLAAWIATYRPSSGTVSVDTLVIPPPTATPSPTAVAAPAPPSTEVYDLVHWAVPLGLLLGFLILVATFVLGAVAQFKRLLRK
ncbi:S8 family serine peptidase [Herbiconiux moechotypicola]|uniref:Peptidase S8/S53 domain-containing protein n=1 Tax=Herbiconiux moechotypicola TaxID=637393 RepID=A0ABN3E611_9MICO|nr:S8 family serine peptidase [Herbiconiux moechotypicola]MCS5731867.1 S8 family serine peptidase [Herbiconiux moechotypicola]